jgi:hypothetical protein
MQFRKNELEFLKVFSKLDDKKGSFPDMVKVTFLPNQIRFYSSFTFSEVIYTIDKQNDIKEEKSVIFSLNLMMSIIASFSDNIPFELTETGINYEGESYNFENHIVNMQNEVEIISLLNNPSDSEALISDIKTLQSAKNYSGIAANKLDAVALYGNYYIASTGYIASILNTPNSSGEGIYLPVNIISLFSENDSIKLKLYKDTFLSDFYYLDFNGIHIILPINSYKLTNLSTNEVREKFSYKDVIEINKVKLYEIVSRLLIVQSMDAQSKLDLHRRVKLSFTKEKIKIEIISGSSSHASTNIINISDSLIGKEVIFSSQDLKDIMDGLVGEKVFISLDTDNIQETYFKLDDENHKSFFIHTPFS